MATQDDEEPLPEELPEFPVWLYRRAGAEVDEVPLMPDNLRNCVAFLYDSLKDAREDEGCFAVGFLVRIKSKKYAGGYNYFVTNEHVIRDKASFVIRVNTTSGVTFGKLQTKNFAIDRKNDLAASQIGVANANVAKDVSVTYVPTDEFISDWKTNPDALMVGAGDELVMVSRIERLKMRYRTQNVSVLRFGNISLYPEHEEKFFLVEMRSISGHSGSPVFVYYSPPSWVDTTKPLRLPFTFKLLGINRGHLSAYEYVLPTSAVRAGRTNARTSHVVQTNMAISQVVPAWKIKELLDCKKFSDRRRKFESK